MRRGGESWEWQDGRGEGAGKERRGMWKASFWNVAGLGNKDEEFWKGLRGWDVMTLIETWTDEKRNGKEWREGLKGHWKR